MILSEETYNRIMNITNGRCFYCGDSVMVHFKQLQSLDHIIPRCKGGTDKESNLVPCCLPCNCSKGTASVEEFREQRRNSVLRRIVDVYRWLKPLQATEPYEVGEIKKHLEAAQQLASEMEIIFYGEWIRGQNRTAE